MLAYEQAVTRRTSDVAQFKASQSPFRKSRRLQLADAIVSASRRGACLPKGEVAQSPARR
jgi:hypothetical protein